MKLIPLKCGNDLCSNQRISGGTPAGSRPIQLEIETTEGGLDLLIFPSLPIKPVPPFIKYTIDEHKQVIIGPKE